MLTKIRISLSAAIIIAALAIPSIALAFPIVGECAVHDNEDGSITLLAVGQRCQFDGKIYKDGTTIQNDD